MCGICGILNKRGERVDEGLVRRMNLEQTHRGPDGDGHFFDGEVGLGHRRLSIIDTEGGGQPIGNEDGSLQVVFNGEIYNYVELRAELIEAGHVFRTKSDTEVIVHAYEEWGEGCVRKFNGMFAFALWNSRDRSLFLARDHLGIKPLYYAEVGDELVFGSEIKALLRHPNVPREVDVESLGELFTFRFVPSPKTLFSRIFKLPPGHLMTVSRGGQKIRRFWDWRPGEHTLASEQELIEEYQRLLEDAVRLQLRSDVPLGLFLSSGVDSGALLSIMSQHTDKRVQTYTLGFESGEQTNEVEDAARMAGHFGADHHYEYLGPNDYVSYYDRYMRDLEEPVGNETAAAFYFLARLTSRHVKVALAGQGADEPWAGYDRYKGVKLSEIYSRFPSSLTRPVGSFVNRLPGRFERMKRGALSLGEADMLTRFTRVYSFFSDELKSELYGGALLDAFRADPLSPRMALAGLQGDVSGLDPLSQMLYIDTRANLPDDLLMVGDKTSMANSLEVRVPFLDVRLVEFIERLPPTMKLKGFTGKYLHKKACRKWLSDDVVFRKKKGFANPVEHWFRGEMKGYIADMLLSQDSAVANYFDQECIRRIIADDQTGKEQHRRHLYLLLSFELWHRAFVGPSAVPA